MIAGLDSGDIVAIVPAAGSGSRMGLDTPKQYLPLRNTTVLQCSIERLLAVTEVKHIVLVIGATDEIPVELSAHPAISVTIGGATRSDSVLSGLVYAANELSFAGAVLIHDAARPCVRVEDINRLIKEVDSSDDGGLLAIPVHDTLKKSDEQQRVSNTIDRHNIWRAVTPQLFNVEKLMKALLLANQQQHVVTDEASAMEKQGYKPRLVQCAQDNIKITERADLRWAQSILEAQEPQ